MAFISCWTVCPLAQEFSFTSAVLSFVCAADFLSLLFFFLAFWGGGKLAYVFFFFRPSVQTLSLLCEVDAGHYIESDRCLNT